MCDVCVTFFKTDRVSTQGDILHVGPQKMVQIHQLGTELPPRVQTNGRHEGYCLSKAGIKYASIFLLHKHMVLLGESVLRWH